MKSEPAERFFTMSHPIYIIFSSDCFTMKVR